MALTKRIQVRSQTSMTENVQSADRNSPSTGKPFFVRAADPNHLSEWVANELRESGRARLTELTRNSILLCQNNPQHGPPEVVAVANSISFPLDHTMLYCCLNDAVVLDPHNLQFQQHLFLIIPNAHAHTKVEQYAFSESRALFGLLDRCIYPNCARCRQSALCLSGNMVFSTITCVTLDSSARAIPWTHIGIGDIVESLPVLMATSAVHLSRPVITPTLDGPGIEIWAVRAPVGRTKGVSIEYARV